jgi:16S rRNA processing protein RimM
LSDAEIILLGKITEPYGIQGWVRVHPLADDPIAWADMATWWVGRDEQSWQAVGLQKCRWHGGGLVALLEGCNDRSAAEALRGQLVGAPRSELPPAGKDEYYWADLIGLDVVNGRGEQFGKVVGLLETGANDVLRVVDGDGPERLLPFVAAVVLDVDVAARRILVEWELDW